MIPTEFGSDVDEPIRNNILMMIISNGIVVLDNSVGINFRLRFTDV